MISRWLTIKLDKNILLIGLRRAGKTTLLKHLFPNTMYKTFDDYDLLRSIKKDPKSLLVETYDSLILDEVQRVPEVLITVKYAIDELKRKFIMTGSSSLGLLSVGTETLAGRIEIQECPTFCWGEEKGKPTHRLFEMPPSPVQIKEAQREIDRVMNYGGFPEVILAENNEEKEAVLKNYKNTYFTKDLLLISNIEDADGLLSILNYLAISLGSHIEISNASQESGVSHPTCKKYLNVLDQSRLTFKLYGYQFGPAKRFIKAKKMYFSDMGIIRALGIPVSQGQLLENFVISEIEKRRKLGSLKTDRLYYYKSTSGAEVDLVIEENGKVKAIEIKNTKNPHKKDVRNLIEFVAQDKKKRKGYLLYLGEDSFTIDTIEILPIAHLYRAY